MSLLLIQPFHRRVFAFRRYSIEEDGRLVARTRNPGRDSCVLSFFERKLLADMLKSVAISHTNAHPDLLSLSRAIRVPLQFHRTARRGNRSMWRPWVGYSSSSYHSQRTLRVLNPWPQRCARPLIWIPQRLRRLSTRSSRGRRLIGLQHQS